MIVTAKNLTEEISVNLVKLKLPESMTFSFVKEYTFPDGFNLTTSFNERMVLLKNNNQNIGVFRFKVDKVIYNFNKGRTLSREPFTILLDFVQGVKKTTPQVQYPKGWQELIVNSLILSFI